jgi:ubiquinone/menaquinone biosynthesis C-methylase UbiE
MDEETLALLCDPLTREPLAWEQEAGGGRAFLRNRRTGEQYPIRDGIPVFVEEAGLTGRNRQFRKLYDWTAIFYDVQSQIYAFLSRQNLKTLRSGFLAELDVRAGDRVLEVSVGTGLNLPLLPPGIEFYGLDLSWGMLRKCRWNLRRWKLPARLFCGEAEHLPFRENSFDVVFQLGGINFFSDKGQAIREMVRVAKPGTRLLISDENEKQIRELYQKLPVLGRRLWRERQAAGPPMDLLPAEVREVTVREHGDGRFYTLTFRKPG